MANLTTREYNKLLKRTPEKEQKERSKRWNSCATCNGQIIGATVTSLFIKGKYHASCLMGVFKGENSGD